MSEQSSNIWFSVSMGLIGVIVGFAVGSGFEGVSFGGPQPTPVVDNGEQLPPPSSAEDVPPVDVAVDHIRGNPNATVSVIEYSDFECPFCQRHHPTMAQILDKYGDDVNLVYRHFPLSFHPYARPAALASECIAEQGGSDAFWEFADRVFGPENDWDFEAHALALGMNMDQFRDCMETEKYASRVTSDMNGGSQAGVSGTPGNIVINNETGEAVEVPGAQPLSAFEQAIDGLL